MNNDTIFGKVGAAFARRWRITLLLLVAILVLGFSLYQTYLPREGFPSIEFPVGNVTVTYFVQDPKAFDEQILKPINEALEGEDYIDTTISQTDGNFGNVFIQFKAGESAVDSMDEVEKILEKEVNFPEGSQFFANPISVDSIDGQNDLIFSMYSKDKDAQEIQDKANELATEILEVEGIVDVDVQENSVVRTDPATGQEFVSKESYTKIGVKNGGDELKFYPAINMGIVGESDLSTLELSDLVQGEVNEILDKDEYEDYLVVYSGDLGVVINQQIDSLEQNFIAGMIAVAIILILFVNWRASIVAVLFIPTVLAGTFIVMALTGATLNVISLFALVLALGLLVDDAIVVIEAIDRNKREGYEGIEAIRKSLNEIGSADLLGTLTTVLVFAPMLFISGVLGDFIVELPNTIIVTLILSLIIALTIVPVLSNWLIKYPKNDNPSLWKSFNKFVDIPSRGMYKLGELVSRFTSFSLNNKVVGAIVFILSIVFIGVGFSFAGLLFSERFNPFPPESDANQFQISANFVEGTTIERAEEISREIEDFVVDEYEDEVVRYDYYFANNRNLLNSIELVDISDRDITAGEIADDIADNFDDLDDAEVRAIVATTGPPSSDFPYLMQVYSEDQETLEALSNDLVEYLGDIEIGDEEVTEVAVDYLQNVTRKDGHRYVEVKAKVSDPDNTQLILEIQNDVKEQFDANYLEENYSLNEDALGYDLGQQSENLDSFQSLGIVSLAALLLMYILLVWQFNSFTQPFLIIFLAIFLATPGVFIGLYTTGNFMSFLTAIGLIGLVGIVVNNTIMLVDFANQYRKETDSASEAMVNSIRVRFRPLVTTTVTTIAGLLPLALAEPFWEPISFTIIFGLLASTTLVIFAFPVYYVLLEWGRNGVKTFFSRFV